MDKDIKIKDDILDEEEEGEDEEQEEVTFE